jgi:hypothetical protein
VLKRTVSVAVPRTIVLDAVALAPYPIAVLSLIVELETLAVLPTIVFLLPVPMVVPEL